MLQFLSQPVATIAVAAGDTTSLHCNVSGLTITSVLWYKNDKPISSDSVQPPKPFPDESKRATSHGISVTKNVGFGYWFSTLTITQLNVTDTGAYQCVAATQQEETISSNITQLLVQCK